MQISDLEFHWIPLREAYAESCGTRPIRGLLLVRLISDGGLEGWGETPTSWREDETASRREHCLPLVAGRSVFAVEELLRLDGLDDFGLRCALEVACRDLIGKVAGQPLCHLSGGMFRDRVPVAVRVEGDAVDAAVVRAREFLEAGFTTQVLVASGRLEEDCRRFLAVREAVPDHIDVQLDAMCRYTMDDARELCASLEEFGNPVVIDPVAEGDLDAVTRLQRQVNVPLAVKRGIREPADVLRLLRSGEMKRVIIDPIRVGGMTRVRECAVVAGSGGLTAALAVSTAAGPATAAMIHTAASTPAVSGCLECPVVSMLELGITGPWEVVDGMVHVPDGPGLGIDVDLQRLDRLGELTG
ncbi:enolase C-terminal domain-like protein [Thermostilla marina]